MAHRFQISQDSQALYITVVTNHRLPVFKTDQMKAVLCRALDEARKSAGFLLFAYVIMIDHMHLLTSRSSERAHRASRDRLSKSEQLPQFTFKARASGTEP